MFLLIIFVFYCLKEGRFLKHLITVSMWTPADVCGRHYHQKMTCYCLRYFHQPSGKQMVEMLGFWEIPTFGIFSNYSTNLKHGVTSRFSHFEKIILKIIIRIHGKRWPMFFHHFGQQIVFCLFTNMGTKKFDQTPSINHINIFHGTVFSLPKIWKTTWISWHTSKKKHGFPTTNFLVLFECFLPRKGSTWQFG